MQTGLHAFGWGLQRVAVVTGAAVFLALLAYSLLVFVIVVGQAATAFGS